MTAQIYTHLIQHLHNPLPLWKGKVVDFTFHSRGHNFGC